MQTSTLIQAENPNDIEVNHFFENDTFLKSLQTVLHSETEAIVPVLEKVFSYKSLSSDEYELVVGLIGKKIFLDAFIYFDTLIQKTEKPKHSFVSYGESLELIFPMLIYRSRLNQIYNAQQMEQEYEVQGKYQFPDGKGYLFHPNNTKNGFSFINIEGISENITGDWTIESSLGLVTIFNHTEKNKVYIYMHNIDSFSVVEGQYLANRYGIPKSILEIRNNNQTIFLDIESDLYFAKKHIYGSDQVSEIYQTDSDNLVIHSSVEQDTRLDISSSISNGDSRQVTYVGGQENIHSMLRSEDVFSYNGDILNFLQLTDGRQFIVGKHWHSKQIQIIDINNGDIITELDDSVRHYLTFAGGSELVIVSYTLEGVEIFFSGTNEMIQGGVDVDQIHYYTLDGIMYTAFQVHYANGNRKNYSVRLEDGITRIEEDSIIEDESEENTEKLINNPFHHEVKVTSTPIPFPDKIGNIVANTGLETSVLVLCGDTTRVNNENKNVFLEESLRIVEELLDGEINAVTLQAVELIISKVGNRQEFSDVLEKYGIRIYSYKGRYEVNRGDMLLVFNDIVFSSKFGSISGITQYNVIGSESAYIGNIKTEIGTFMLRFTDNNFEFCQLFDGEKNTVTLNGKTYRALENPVYGMDLVDEEEDLVIQIGFTIIAPEQDIMDGLLDVSLDGSAKRYRIALFLDDKEETYVVFDGLNFSQTYKIRDKHFSKSNPLGNSSEPVFH